MSGLSQFRDGESEVRLLVDICRRPAEEGESLADRNNTIRRAAVVLLVSHFESYLKLIAEEFIDSLSGGKLQSRQIPRGIRELHTLPRMAEILSSGDGTQRGVLLKRLPEVSVLWNEDAKPSPGILKASVLSREVTNADSLTIDKLFDLMGSKVDVCDGDIDIPSGEDGDLLPVNIRFSLKDVVKCRNDIAHGDIDRKPTEEDVERYLAFLSALVGRLQRKANALLEAYAP